MIVDLLRNDLSRIARTGSVAVSDLFRLERYPTLWQLTSQVTATARPGTTLLDVFGALFPCGSVTGAPKQRTMALIRELEPGPRGVYCGAVGLLAPPGAPVRARFNVAIRTVVVDSRSGAAVYGAGGGITWDSDAAAERAELTAKAAVLSHDADDPDLLETLAFVPGEGLRNLDRHLARMLDSAAYLGYRLDPEEVTGALRAALAHAPAPARVRVTADRLGQVSVTLASLPPAPEGAVRLAVDEEPVDSASVWLAHKTTRREVYTSRARRHPHADDVVCLNERAELTETTVANLAVKLDGRWWTPPVACGALPGVERGRLVELGTLGERVLTVGDLHGAQELAVVSSLRGWRRAVLAPDPS